MGNLCKQALFVVTQYPTALAAMQVGGHAVRVINCKCIAKGVFDANQGEALCFVLRGFAARRQFKMFKVPCQAQPVTGLQAVGCFCGARQG